jgi:homoserine O-acetyltransferase
MQVLQWMIDYPDFVKAAIPVATTTHLGAQSIAFDAVGRQAILADTNFSGGQYQGKNGPDRGLAIARMIGHITYLSEQGMREKFGRNLRYTDRYGYDFSSEFAVETYLDYQGQTFVERFDANSYLYITKAADYFDLQKDHGSLKKAFGNVQARSLVVSFASDWLFTPSQSRAIVEALAANRKDVTYCDIASAYGHDAFLLETETLGAFISCFLDVTYKPDKRKQAESCCAFGKRPLDEFTDNQRIRVDYERIESLIEPNSTVLDVGCGDGQLLANLIRDKNIQAEGIELRQEFVLDCVCRGLPTIQQDIEKGLEYYTDKSFDYVILSQTVQTLRDPEKVFTELLRVGKKVVVSFPNFAHWRCRAQLLLRGKAPVTKSLPFTWHNSPNIHVVSLKDFDEFCRKLGVKVEKKVPLAKKRKTAVRIAPNLFAEQAIYVTSLDA